MGMWYPDEDFVVWVHDIMLERFGGFSSFERGLSCFAVILSEVKAERGLYRRAALMSSGLSSRSSSSICFVVRPLATSPTMR